MGYTGHHESDTLDPEHYYMVLPLLLDNRGSNEEVVKRALEDTQVQHLPCTD